MKRYTYRVVSGNGSGVWSEHRLCAAAKKAAAKRATTMPADFGPLEIERVEPVGRGSRYWMRKGSRWVEWDPREDVDERQPDWLFAASSASARDTPREETT